MTLSLKSFFFEVWQPLRISKQKSGNLPPIPDERPRAAATVPIDSTQNLLKQRISEVAGGGADEGVVNNESHCAVRACNGTAFSGRSQSAK